MWAWTPGWQGSPFCVSANFLVISQPLAPLQPSLLSLSVSQSACLLRDSVIFHDALWVRTSAVQSQRGWTGGRRVLPGRLMASLPSTSSGTGRMWALPPTAGKSRLLSFLCLDWAAT